MTSETYLIREIEQKDNTQIAAVIRSVLIEMGVPKVGTAYEDKALDIMYETYNKKMPRISLLNIRERFSVEAVLHSLTILKEIPVSCRKCIFYRKLEERD